MPASHALNLLRARHSTRDFDDSNPITLAELSQFLDNAARIKAQWESRADLGDGSGPMIAYTVRPYPSAGSSYELELYLDRHQLQGTWNAASTITMPTAMRWCRSTAQPQDIEAQLESAELSRWMRPDAPQILITIAARFDRISWKYSSIAYSLILKDVGV